MSTFSMRIETYLIEYLDKFEFIFETILDYESGDQMGTFDAKKPPSKISCLGTFKFRNSDAHVLEANGIRDLCDYDIGDGVVDGLSSGARPGHASMGLHGEDI